MKKTIYLFKIQPSGFNINLSMAFEKIPSVEQLISAIETECKKQKIVQAFIDRSVSCIKTYGIPKMKENGQYVVNFKDMGDSKWSSKGFAILKEFNLY